MTTWNPTSILARSLYESQGEILREQRINRLSGCAQLAFGTNRGILGEMAALRPIYTAATADAAREALDAFAESDWGAKYPTIVQSWR